MKSSNLAYESRKFVAVMLHDLAIGGFVLEPVGILIGLMSLCTTLINSKRHPRFHNSRLKSLCAIAQDNDFIILDTASPYHSFYT